MGSSTVLFRTMTHGRAAHFADIDLSRSVGYWVSEFPVLLHLSPEADHLEGVRAAHAQMQEIPNHGMGYRILAEYAGAMLRTESDSGPASSIRLNYVGDTEHLYGGLSLFRLATGWEDAVVETRPQGPLIPWHPQLDITASIEGGDLLLWMTYHERAYRRETIERFAGRMIEILRQLSTFAMQSGI
jgi:non-ribosomal peptide synthase protein (TIGR01720 family)